MKQNLTLKKMLFISLLTAQGIILSLLEQAIPFPFAFAPGAKLGVANIITVIGLYTLSLQEVVLVVLLRTLLTALLGGTFSTLLYSSAGATFSLLGMLLIKQLGPKRVSLIGVSATGGILHNCELYCQILDSVIVFTSYVHCGNFRRNCDWDFSKLCIKSCKNIKNVS